MHGCLGTVEQHRNAAGVRNARDLYTRRAEGVSIWVVRASDITSSDPDAKGEFFESPQGKEYRHATYYKESEAVPHL